MGAVGGLVLLTCLAASFLAGRYFGERSGFHDGLIQAGHAKLLNLHGSNDLTTIRARPPETNLIKPLLVKAEADSGGAPARMISTLSSAPPPSESSAEKTIAPIVEWVPGLTYIVAQEFAADCGDEPTKAQAFLGQSGVSTQPVRMRNGSVQLITVQGFNHKVPEQKRQSEDLLRKIQSLGAEYYAKGGGYRLKGYFKTHKTESR